MLATCRGRRLRVAPGRPTHPHGRPGDRRRCATAGGVTITNGILTVEVDPTDGTFAVDGHAGLGRLVDGGDCGDTYNWCPPADDTVVDAPTAVAVDVAEAGPRAGRPSRPHATAGHPCRGRAARRRGAHEVRTTLELHAGERPSGSSRARQPRRATTASGPTSPSPSRADVGPSAPSPPRAGPGRRGRPHRAGPAHLPVPTLRAGGRPDRGARGGARVRAGRRRDGQRWRAGPHPAPQHRDAVAGTDGHPPPAGRPLVRLEGSQVQGPLDPARSRWRSATSTRCATRCWCRCGWQALTVPAGARRGPGGAGRPGVTTDLPASGSGLTVEGAEVASVVREGGLVVRVFNPGRAGRVTVEGRHGWLVDLGAPAGAVRRQLRPPAARQRP